MKKVIILSSLACLGLVACGESENKKSETPLQTEQPSINADSAAAKTMDTLKASVDKKSRIA